MNIVNNLKAQADWYVSYMDDDQGKSLVLCQQKKIEQLESLLETIVGEMEEYEYSADDRLYSIKYLIEHIEPIEYTVGFFTWTEKETKK